jgi:hypothetical protein
MRLSSYPINTLRDVPADAEVVSHQLMLRAGLIRRLAAGLYTWLPIGLKVLRKVENIVREEMNRAGAFELLMPTVQPAELWQESGRWDQFGPELLRLKDRNERPFCYGPTHEEVITDIARRELKSYRQLPVNFYQIQTKFRDEIRPRFGVMRAREFTMKDAYSFHARRGIARAGLPGHVRGLLTDLLAHEPALPRRAGRHRQHRRQRLAGVPRACRLGRGRDRVLGWGRLRRQPRDGRGAGAGRAARPGDGAAAGSGHAQRAHDRRADCVPEGRGARCLKTLLVEGTDGRRGAGGAWRPRTERRQGAEAARRAVAAQDGDGRASARGDQLRAWLHRPRRPESQGLRRPRGRAGGRLRLRRQPPRRAPGGCQLGPRPAGAGGCRPAQRRAGRPEPVGQGHARHRARHRGRPHLPARSQVQPGDERHRARRAGPGRDHVHGLLWHWCDARRGGRDRTESR